MGTPVYLHWEGRRAAYATLDEARTQAEHDAAVGMDVESICDEDGVVLVTLQEIRGEHG